MSNELEFSKNVVYTSSLALPIYSRDFSTFFENYFQKAEFKLKSLHHPIINQHFKD